MPHSDNTANLDAATLARFVPISELSEAHRSELCNHATVQRLQEGEVLNGAPALATHLMFVLDGAIEVSGGPYPMENVEAGTTGSRFAVAGMESTLRQIKASRPSSLLLVDRAKTSTLLIWAQSNPPGTSTTQTAREQADIAALLLDSQLLAQIPPSNIDRISELVERLEVSAGETVITQGDPGEHYYVVESGRCEVLRSGEDGGPPVRLAELGKGTSFGEEALLTDTPRNATIRMLTPGILLRLNRTYFLELISHPLLVIVDHERAEDLIAMGGRWVDVRTPEEFGHDGLDGAINLPLGNLREKVDELSHEDNFVTYCDSGRRAQAAAFLLSQRGFQVCCLREGIGDRRPRARAAHTPTEVLPRLQEELARTEAALENAIDDVASAEAQHAVLSQRLEGSVARKRAEARLQAAEAKVTRAQSALEQVKEHKLAMDQKVRDAEAEAASRRRHAEAQCERMRQETQALLEQEKQHLAQQYREASARLAAIEDARLKAEAHFEAERRRLQSEFEAARARIEQEASRIRTAMESAREEAETKAEALRTRHISQEEQLRRDTEAALAQERTRLESEVARSMAAQEEARQHLASTEAERKAAELEAAELRKTMAAEEDSKRQQDLLAREEEAQRLLQERESTADQLMSAKAAREEAEQRRADLSEKVMNATMGGERQQRLMADLKEFEQEVQLADNVLSEAQLAHEDAQEAVEVAVEVAATTRQREEELRLKLYEEMELFISEEERRSSAELERTERYANEYERIQQENETRKRQEEQATASMFDELKGILEGASEDDPFDMFARQRLVAEEKARLVRDARVKASERTRAAREVVESSKNPDKPDAEPSG